jgi:DNA-binding transcriptional ArsR family regulator
VPLTNYVEFYTFIRMQVSEVSGLDGCAVASTDSARVAVVAESLIDVDVASDLAELFRLLGDPTRVRILYALLEAGELCVCDLAEVVGTSDTKVSQALRLLRGAGAVRNRRDVRNVFYRLDDAHVRMLLDVSREHVSHQHGGE